MAALTVLMPVYNAGKYLSQAIDSILSQTFSDFEFVIIDDGSTDDSVDIINSYNDSRIRLIKNEGNLGISKTLNKGIELSSAELIARMDADDISYPDRLQLQYDFFQQFPDTVLLSSSVRMIDTKNNPVEDVVVDNYFNCYYLNFICAQYHPTIMYKRSVVLAHGGYNVPYSEDFDLWWRLMAGNNRLAHIEKILLDYRMSDNSLSRVLRKAEYDLANDKLLVRNMQFYTGPDFEFTNNELKFLQHIYDPLLDEGNVHSIIRGFKKLDYVTKRILSKPNVSYKPADLLPQVKIKKDFAFNYYYVKLPRSKAIRLLFGVYPFNEALSKLVGGFIRKIKR